MANNKGFQFPASDNDISVWSKEPLTNVKYYVHVEIRVLKNYSTNEVTVRALLGLANDGSTPIQFPVDIWCKGYWTKGKSQLMLRKVEALLLAEVRKLGYDKATWTAPLEIRAYWD